jgi:DNA modification methylase
MATARVLIGDVRAMLRTLPDESVHCCVTSPPYWGLRDYGVAGQLGLESSPAEFVANMVEVFREVRRVLRKDATCWINMGDSYATNTGANGSSQGATGQRHDRRFTSETKAGVKVPPGLKPKDLCGIPWRLAFALQDDGWWLRQDIIWAKRSPMPESVTDRCTKAHEYIFLLTKSATYFYDAVAVRESGKCPEMSPGGRNLRSVWTLSTEPFSLAHFATFPSELPRRCIKAGTSEKGCCPACLAPYRRVTDKTKLRRERPNDLTKRNGADGTGNHCANTTAGVAVTTRGWEPTCQCGAGDPIPCTVLDPFSGSGTTGMAATELGRNYIGCELNPEYAAMSEKRIWSWKTRDAEKAPEPMPGQLELFAAK